jgi:hypothetical protein
LESVVVVAEEVGAAPAVDELDVEAVPALVCAAGAGSVGGAASAAGVAVAGVESAAVAVADGSSACATTSPAMARPA